MLPAEPDADAMTEEYTMQAHELLAAKGLDLNGSGWTPAAVELLEGGE